MKISKEEFCKISLNSILSLLYDNLANDEDKALNEEIEKSKKEIIKKIYDKSNSTYSTLILCHIDLDKIFEIAFNHEKLEDMSYTKLLAYQELYNTYKGKKSV